MSRHEFHVGFINTFEKLLPSSYHAAIFICLIIWRLHVYIMLLLYTFIIGHSRRFFTRSAALFDAERVYAITSLIYDYTPFPLPVYAIIFCRLFSDDTLPPWRLLHDTLIALHTLQASFDVDESESCHRIDLRDTPRYVTMRAAISAIYERRVCQPPAIHCSPTLPPPCLIATLLKLG